MRKKRVACGKCRKTRPAAVKAQVAALNKAYGREVRPVRVAGARKPPRPRCPDPACGKKGGRKANCCPRCGTPFSPASAARAEKSARSMLQTVNGTAEYYERQAALQHDPGAREALAEEASRARLASGRVTSHAALQVLKASGARTLAEALVREHDPHVRETMRAVLGDAEGRRRP